MQAATFNECYFLLAKNMSPHEFYKFCFVRKSHPFMTTHNGFVWCDNGAALDSNDYAVFLWERVGQDYKFRGQVRLMGGVCFVEVA